MKLTEISPRGIHAVFETLRSVLHSGRVSSRVQYMIEVMFAIRKDKFQVGYLAMVSIWKKYGLLGTTDRFKRYTQTVNKDGPYCFGVLLEQSLTFSADMFYGVESTSPCGCGFRK